MPLASRPKEELASIARDNWRLLQAGSYRAGGVAHGLGVGGFANRTSQVAPQPGGRILQPRYRETRVSVAAVDTATALRVLCDHEPAALNFANAYHVGGGYLSGARAQEEDLCRLMPQLYSQLRRLRYPIAPRAAHYTQTLLCRRAGSYELAPPLRVAIVSSAMPNLGGAAGGRKGTPRAGSAEWEDTVRLRIRAVLAAAVAEKHPAVVLGAFGCGAFGNPPADVARLFAEALASDEFRGAGTGRLRDRRPEAGRPREHPDVPARAAGAVRGVSVLYSRSTEFYVLRGVNASHCGRGARPW